MYEIYAHCGVFIAYASEFLMIAVDLVIIVSVKTECEVCLVFAEFIFLRMVAQPCQLTPYP